MPTKASIFGSRIRSGSIPTSALGGGAVSSSAQVATGSFTGSFIGSHTGSILANNNIFSSSAQVNTSTYVTPVSGTLTLNLSTANNFIVTVNQNINNIVFTNTTPNSPNKINVAFVRVTGSVATSSYAITWPTASFSWNGRRPRNDYFDGEGIVSNVQLTSYDGTNWIGVDNGDSYSGSGYSLYYAGSGNGNVTPGFPYIFYTPTQMGTGSTWVSSSIGSSFALGLQSNGTMWSWGTNNYGQLGVGSSSAQLASSPTPVQVGTGSGWSKIFAIASTAYAIDTGSNLYAWGYAGAYQLGDGQTANVTSPKKISPAGIFKKVTMTKATNFVYGLTTGSTIYIWGGSNNAPSYYEDASLGTGPYPTPTALTNIATASFVDIEGIPYGAIAISSSGVLYSWGRSSYGENGFPQSATMVAPTISPGANAFNPNSSWSYAANGGNVTYLISSSKDLYAMGYDSSYYNGIMGQGSASSGAIGTASIILPSTKNWQSVWPLDSAPYAIIARTTASTAYTWGVNAGYGLGIITGSPTSTTYLYSPTQLSGSTWGPLPYGGGSHGTSTTVIGYPLVQTDGTMKTWGVAAGYELGLSNNSSITTISQLPTSSWVGNTTNRWRDAIVLNNNIAFAIRASDGALFSNYVKTSGYPTFVPLSVTNPPPALTQIPNTYDFVRIWPSYDNTMCIFEKIDGSLYAYNANYKEMLGYDTAPYTISTTTVTYQTIAGYKLLYPLAPLPNGARPKIVNVDTYSSLQSVFVLDENGQIWGSTGSTVNRVGGDEANTNTYSSGWVLFGYAQANTSTIAGFNTPGFFKNIVIHNNQGSGPILYGVGTDGNMYVLTTGVQYSSYVALRNDGTLWSGTPSYGTAPTASIFSTGSSWVKVVAGNLSAYARGFYGLGSAATGSSSLLPSTQIGTGSGWVDVFSKPGSNLVYALDTGSNLYAWGDNTNGNVGTGPATGNNLYIVAPALVTSSINWKKMTNGGYGTMFLSR